MKILLASAGLALGAFASAQTITTGAAFAPNAFGSGTFAGWAANTITAIQAGTSPLGTPGTPEYYDNVAGTTYATKTNIATNFDSWKGQAPSPAGYAGELGTRMHFPVKIVSDITFTLSDVLFDMNSSDIGNAFDFDGDLAGTDFSSGRRRGVNYGGDGVLGGGDDTVYYLTAMGNDMTPLNELEYVGIGNAAAALTSDLGATDQDKIDGVAAATGSYNLTTKYSLKNRLGTGTAGVAFVQPVPEPATMAVLGLGALGMLRRRKAGAAKA